MGECVIARNGSGVRVKGTQKKACVCGEKIKKGDFIKCTGYQTGDNYRRFSEEDPEYVDMGNRGPTYALVFKNTLIKVWSSNPYLARYCIKLWDSPDYFQHYFSMNIYVEYYNIDDGVVDWNSKKGIIFDDIVLTDSELFNDDGTPKEYTKYFSGPVLILYFVWIIFNLVLIYSCYARICDESDVDMEQKPSRFAFVNKMRAESEERSRAAAERQAKYKEEKRKKRISRGK